MPRKKSNNSMYYDPNYRRQYDILNNINAVNKAGTQLQSSVHRYAEAYDSEYRKQYEKAKKQYEKQVVSNKPTKQQNNISSSNDPFNKLEKPIKEDNWYDSIINTWKYGFENTLDDKVNQALSGLDDGIIKSTIKFLSGNATSVIGKILDNSTNSPNSYRAKFGKTIASISSGLYTWGKLLVEDPDKAFSLAKDNWRELNREMNRLQAEDFGGLITRGQALQSDIEGYKTYLNIQKEIDKTNQQLQSINQNLSEGKGVNISQNKKIINDLIKYRQDLIEQQKQYESAKENIENYEPSTVGKLWDDFTAALPDFWTNNSLFGKNTPFHDQLNDVTKNLFGVSAGSDSSLIDGKLKILDKTEKALNALNADWQEGFRQNMEEMESYKVSNAFRQKADNTPIEFFNPDTYLYKMGGLIGGSSSSYMKQIPAMALQIGVGLATSGASFEATAAANALAGAAGFSMNYGAGVAENNAEAALAFKERLEDELKRTPKYNTNQTLYDDLIKEGRAKLGKRSKKLTDEEVFDLWRTGMYNSDNPAVNRAKVTALKGINNQFRSDMIATTSDAFVDTAINMVPFGKAAKGSMIRNVKAEILKDTRKISPGLAQRITDLGSAYEKGAVINPIGGAVTATGKVILNPWLEKAGSLGKNISNKISKAVDIGLSKDLDKVLKRNTALKYTKDIGGRVILSAISEGIEEGKQAVNAEKYKSGQYDTENIGTAKMIFNDFLSGSRMAGLMLGMPLEGWMSKADQDMLQEIKGGMIGGFGHTATIQVLQNTVPFIKQRSADKIIAENILLSKLGDIDYINKAQMYSKYAKTGIVSSFFKRTNSNFMQETFDTIRKLNKQEKERTGQEFISDEYINQEEQTFRNVVKTSLDPNTIEEARKQGIKKNSDNYHRFVAIKSKLQEDVKEDSAKFKENQKALQTRLNQLEDEIAKERIESKSLEQYTDQDERAVQDAANRLTRSVQLSVLFDQKNKIEQSLNSFFPINDRRVKRGLLSELRAIDKQIKDIKESDVRFKNINNSNELQAYNSQVPNFDELYNTFYDYIQSASDLNISNTALSDFITNNANFVLDNINRTHINDDKFESAIESVDVASLNNQDLRTYLDVENNNNAESNENDPNQNVPVDVIPTKDPNLNTDELVKDENGDEIEYSGDNELKPGEFVDPKTNLIWRTKDSSKVQPDLEKETKRVDNEFEESWRDPEKKTTSKSSTKQLEIPFEEQKEGELITTSDTSTQQRGESKTSEVQKPEEKEGTKSTKSQQLSFDFKDDQSNHIEQKPVNNPILDPTDSINETLDLLDEKQKKDKEEILNDEDGYHTTNSDYFILVDGVPTRMSRVHSVKPEAYINPQTDTILNIVAIYNKIINDETLSIEQKKNAILEQIDKEDPEFVDLIPYRKYIEERFEDIVNDKAELQRTFTSIAKQSLNRSYGISVEVGNIVDKLARDFFGNSILSSLHYLTIEQQEYYIQELWNSIANESEGRTYKTLFNDNYQSFKQLISDLSNLSKQFEYLGWSLRTTPYTWRANFPQTGWVAGETDMVAVDRNGDIHIIDFKTSYSDFTTKAYSSNDANIFSNLPAQIRAEISNITTNINNQFAEELQSLTEKDVQMIGNTPKLNKKARTVLSKIRESNPNISGITLVYEDGKVVSALKRSKFYFTTGGTQVLSQYEDYSNQQTIYAMLINNEIGSRVASVELMPFVCQYEGANYKGLQYIISIRNSDENNKPIRIPLMIKSEMQDILLGRIQDKETDNNEFIEQFNQAFSLLEQSFEILTEGFTYENLSDVNKEKYNNIKSFVDQITESLNEANNIVDLDSIYSNITDLQTQIRQFLEEINAEEDAKFSENSESKDAKLTKDREENHVQEEDNSQPESEKNSDEPVYDPVFNPEPIHSSPTVPPSAPVSTQPNGRNPLNIRTNLDYITVMYNDQLGALTNAKDLITNGQFILYIKRGNLYTDITLGDVTIKEVPITIRDRNGNFTKNGAKLYNKVLKLQNSLQPGQKVVADNSTINRTTGRILLTGKNGSQILVLNKKSGYAYIRSLNAGKYGEWQRISIEDVQNNAVSVPALTSGLFIESDIYDIEFSTQYGKVGFVNNGQVQTFNGSTETGGITDTSRSVIYTWSTNEVNAPENGTLIFLKESPRDELSSNPVIPVALDKRGFSDRDADFIVNSLLYNNLDDKYIYEINGSTYNTGATYRQLLNLMIPVLENPMDLGNMKSIVLDPKQPGVVYIMSRTDLASNNVSQNRYDLNDPGSRNAFKEVIRQLTIAERHDVLMSRIGAIKSDIDARLPFSGIKKFFGQYGTTKHTDIPIRNLDITDALQFDIEDFMNHKSSDGSIKKGLSGLGWYLKHGILTTQYKGISSSNVEIKDARIENENVEVSKPHRDESKKQDEPILSSEDNGNPLDDFNGLFKLVKPGELTNAELTSQEEIKQHLHEIFGEEYEQFTEILNSIIPLTGCNASAIGRCSADSISIFEGAVRGTEFHEAFHRIFELVIDDTLRNTIYKQIAKRLGVDLNNDPEYKNAREVAEWVADKFMDYSNNYYTDKDRNIFGIKLPKLISKAFNRISNFINAMRLVGNFRLANLYVKARNGYWSKHSHIDKITKDKIDRFNKLYKNLYYEVNGTKLQHIINDAMFDKISSSITYLLMVGNRVDPSGNNITGMQITKQALKTGIDIVNRNGLDLLGENSENLTAGQLALKEIYEKLDQPGIKDRIAASVQALTTKAKEIEDENTENADGDEESVLAASIGEHTRSSYEFSRFDKTSQRVKFFLSTVPAQNEDGSLKLNEYGLPSYMNQNYVFNEVISQLCDCNTVQEILDKLAFLEKVHPMYKIIRGRITRLNNTVYKDGVRNANQEALLAQLMTTIKSHKHLFQIIKATRNKDGKYTLKLQNSDSDYVASYYPSQWSQALAYGATDILKINKYGQLELNPKLQNSSYIFGAIGAMFDKESTIANKNGWYNVGIKQLLSNSTVANPKQVYLNVKVLDKENSTSTNPVFKVVSITDPTNQEQLNILKDKIVQSLNYIGIQVSREEFDYMLMHKYGSSDHKALNAMFQSTDKSDSMNTFITFLKTISNNGRLNLNYQGQIKIGNDLTSLDNVYSKMAFVRNLANWKQQYRHAHDQLTVLAIDNKKFYQVSDNNYITDTAASLNRRAWIYKQLLNDPYCYFEDFDNEDAFGEHPIYGSATIKQLKEDPTRMISVGTLIGFKTDTRGDGGSDYFQISQTEDYISKMCLLQSGAIVNPTMSDKKTYHYILGITLPGINYNNIQSNVLSKVIVPDNISNDYRLTQNDAVCQQMLEYAMCEYRSVKIAQEKLKNMTEEERKANIVNYYTKLQGAKFASLLGVYVDGKFKSFNTFKENTIEEVDKNIKQAEKYFFGNNITDEERKAMIAELLNRITLQELSKIEELGLIERNNQNNECEYYNFKNVGLDDDVIQAIYNKLTQGYTNISEQEKDRLMSLAIINYINDISNKHIMSIHEVEKVFTGNPSFYKWKYDKEGNLTDRTVDELKRLGGPNSTGQNNFTELQDVPTKYLDSEGNFSGEYVCAEVDNEMVQSSMYEELVEQMYNGELLTAVYNFSGGKIDNIEQLSKEELENILPPDVLQIVKEKAKAASDSFKLSKEEKLDGIDVADGGAYMTDTMTEMLLRMVGSYSNEIEHAFKILREEIPSTYLQKQQAYAKVVTTVIGTQKYTAFGKRMSDGLLTTYYDKFALFPLFDSVAAGRSKNILDKMRQQGIDVLKVNSAIKVGSQGSKPVTWNDYRQNADLNDPSNYIDGKVGDESALKPIFEDSFEFNTYSQRFDYLRKQLNTDPKEETEMALGVQMTKVAMSNLFLNRKYVTKNGYVYTGEQLRDRIMDDIIKLAEIGEKSIRDRFFTDGKLDNKKVSSELIRMLSSRTADTGVQKALQIVPVYNEQGQIIQYDTALPLEAMSNESLIESVLTSTINKQVIDINTPGGAFIQRSVWAMEGSQLYNRSNILSDNNLPITINGGKKLKMINEEGSMDCVLSIDFIEKMLTKDGKPGIPEVPIRDKDGNIIYDYVKDEKGNKIPLKDKQGNNRVAKDGTPLYKRKMRTREMSFDEKRAWLINRGIIGPKATANIIGYRIPTQAQSSIHALRCVDVIPVVNDTIILPEEFTKITGSDFDIDKLFLSAIQYDVSFERGEDGKLHQVVTDKFIEGSKAQLTNSLIKNYLTLLMDRTSKEDGTPRTSNILHRSIDNDTELLKKVMKELGLETSSIETPYSFYSLSKQTDSKNDYVTGKIGIGPEALNNTNHILTMLYGVKFKGNNTLMSKLSLTDLSRHNDKYGESILSWLSALINAHVDIAKDPYISKLNVNKFTYNLANLLVRTGFGKDTFYFLGQPILKKLAAAYNKSQSKYMKDPDISQYTLWKNEQDEILKEMFGDFFGIELNDGSVITLKDAIEIIDSTNKSKLQKQLLNKINDTITENFVKLKKEAINYNANGTYNKQTQALVYLAYLQFNPYAQSLASLVKYCKIDTKKQGKSLLEQLAFEEGYKELKENKLFEPKPLENLLNSSYINTKTELSINLMRDILGGQLLNGTQPVRNAVKTINNMLGRDNFQDDKLIKKISKSISSYIKSLIMNEYFKDARSDQPNFMHDLVSPSKENLSFTIKQGTNTIQLTSKSQHPLNTYIGTIGYFQYTGQDGKIYTKSFIVIGVDQANRTLYINENNNWNYSGKLVLQGGRNTMQDRFNRMMIAIQTNPKYASMLDENGHIKNELLKQIVSGAVVDCGPNDTYEQLKFLKLFNAANDTDISSNYIKQDWEELLQSEFPEIRRFAEDLIAYAFITSGDMNGFTKIFKHVPESWKINSGFGDQLKSYIFDFYNHLNYLTRQQLDDIILNNWFDDQFVRPVRLSKKNPETGEWEEQFICSYREVANQYGHIVRMSKEPILIAACKNTDDGQTIPTMDPDTCPRFVKIKKRTAKRGTYSQDNYNVYRLLAFGTTSLGNAYPIYAKVQPKGNRIYQSGTYDITEYGRSDRNNEFDSLNNDGPVNIQALIKYIYDLGNVTDQKVFDDIKAQYGEVYSTMIEDIIRSGVEQFTDELEQNSSDYKRAVNELNEIEDIDDSENELPSVNRNKSDENRTEESHRKTYTGMINQLLPNQIFVFGSNTQGRHSKGAALTARNKFGAIYGQAEGPQGQSYAIITKDLTKSTHPSRTEDQIIEQIHNLYEYARQNPDKEFVVAYSGTGSNLNAYSNEEMAKMFASEEIPSNIVFEQTFDELVSRYEITHNSNILSEEELKEAQEIKKHCKGE